MRTLRRHVPRLVVAWLLCQASVMAAVPIALCAGDIDVAREVGLACTCVHGDDHECPMHHPKAKPPASCSCTSAHEGPIATLVSLIGPTAVLTSHSTAAAAVASSASWTGLEPVPFDSSIIPDPPPPRA